MIPSRLPPVLGAPETFKVGSVPKFWENSVTICKTQACICVSQITGSQGQHSRQGCVSLSLLPCLYSGFDTRAAGTMVRRQWLRGALQPRSCGSSPLRLSR